MVRVLIVLLLALFVLACGGERERVASPVASLTREVTPTGTAQTPGPVPSGTTVVEATQRPSPVSPHTPTQVSHLTGVAGRALVGPTCPVEREDEPCPDRPWQGVVVAKILAGAEVGRTESNADGRFEMQLPPGEYELIAEPDGFLPAPISLYVTVLPDQVLEVVLMLDSGIR
jgi:hypothetical protein